MNLLCISNGHGEDTIAVRILTAIRQRAPTVDLHALPISGAGHAYHRAVIPVIAQAKALPSGGFLNRDPQQLAKDLGGGLIQLTRSQLSAIRTWATITSANSAYILAVGDIVPLLFAYYSGLSYSFLGTAKSEYWLRDESGRHPSIKPWDRFEGWSGSVYLPWERWLMSRQRCDNAFVRDEFTATHLLKRGIPAQYLGNPMMDGLMDGLMDDLSPSDDRLVARLNQDPAALSVLLLPGSRQPEAYDNWVRIVASLPGLIKAFPDRPLVLLAAIAPTLSRQKLTALLPSDWTGNDHDKSIYRHQSATLILSDAFNDCLHQAEIAIATAGTATEQFVGLGKPAITLPGNGPQFTRAFATVQSKMLGPSVQMVEEVSAVGRAIANLISDSDQLQLIHKNGKHRMGEPGAGDRIAKKVLEIMTNNRC
ncbi:MAG: lipid-A-disaccharide synthase-related protein [Cyanobacteria bacterium P01_D01_bin.1]